MNLPNLDGRVLPAVEASLAAEKISERDQGAAALAVRYAKAIDDKYCSECGSKGDILDRIGPKLLAALSALNLTPAARNVPKASMPQAAKSPLELVREKAATA